MTEHQTLKLRAPSGKTWFRVQGLDETSNETIDYWIVCESEEEVRRIATKRGMTEIEWVREETPPYA